MPCQWIRMRRGWHFAAEEIAEAIVAARGVNDDVDGRGDHTDMQIEADVSGNAVGGEVVGNAGDQRQRDDGAEFDAGRQGC